MVKPALDPKKPIAVDDKNDMRFALLGTDLAENIGKDDVKVKYPAGTMDPPFVTVKKAKVKNSVLIVRTDNIDTAKEKTAGDDEISVTVTNPGSEESEPVEVTVVFEEGK